MRASWLAISLSVALLAVAFTNWGLISFTFLAIFLIFQYEHKGRGQSGKPWSSLGLSLAVSLCTAALGFVIVILSTIIPEDSRIWESSFLKIAGLSRLNLSKDIGELLLFFVPKFAVIIVAIYGLCCQRWREFGSLENEAFEARAFSRSFVLPTVQIIAGSIYPRWLAFPYFICSCAGLFHWSMTSNFFGLSWGWRPLLVYNGLHILLLYLRQLSIPYTKGILAFVDYIGLFEISTDEMTWARSVQSISLLALYVSLCFAIGDMEDFDYGVKQSLGLESEVDLNESLLQSPRLARSRRWWISEQRRSLAFKKAAVRFFAYGFPICLVALVCWSFKFESFCAFFLLLYVGTILYIFPSLFLLRRLNAMLLGFILLWTLCTYIFNAGFTIMDSRFEMDVILWQTIGLWRYTSPGLFLLAQFALGVLVATDLFVGNSILDHYQEGSFEYENITDEGEQRQRWILSMAMIAWCLKRSAHVISLVLIFIVALKSGLIHAVYMVFFMVYLLSSSVAKKTRQYLMLYCEFHIGLLYLLQLEWTSSIIINHEDILEPVLSQLGLWNRATYKDYVPVAVLLCFCAVQNHGIKVIGSLSAVARQTAVRYRPFVLSVYGSSGLDSPSSTENWITEHLLSVSESFRATYRSLGTYVVFGTVFVAVYATQANYVAFGFVVLLLLWIIGRQLLGKKSKLPFSLPLFLYTCMVFISRYLLSVFPDLQQLVGIFLDLKRDLGFNPSASLLLHLWDSLAILSVLQLYRFERSQSSNAEYSSISNNSVMDFLKRLLILHSSKILAIAVFYASVSPVSGLGFIYLLLLVLTSTIPKTSKLPSRIYALYTGILLVLEYLYQIGEVQFVSSHKELISWLGFRIYDNGYLGSASKWLVLLACMVQYCSFQWLEQVPTSLQRTEEPCALFYDPFHERGGLRSSLMGIRRKMERQNSKESAVKQVNVSSPDGSKVVVKSSPSLTSKESRKWVRRAVILKQEKYEAQWKALKITAKYLLENFFTVFGTEVIMLSLLVGAFAVLNIFSLVYILVLALCILLKKRYIRPLWPVFAVLFACILVGEYAALAKLPPSFGSKGSNEVKKHCHDCWDNSKWNMDFCWRCWLGFVDDRQVLVAYFMVFIITTFQIKANKSLDSASVQWKNICTAQRLAWAEISYGTTTQWTWLDYLRFFFYRHLLHVVLLLVFVTGTLQYDLLHLGYLAFSMVFFHIRTTIMKQRNRIFFFLRLYNFSLVVCSLIFQAPFFGYLGSCTPSSIFGLYKYDYGFKITARSALVDITIFCLVSLQSRIFSTKEFEQVLRYLEAEQVEARANAHEKKAEWKKEQLQRIREIEERKTQRRLQVDKMKMDMVPLQLRLDVLNSASKFREAFSLPNDEPRSPRLVNSLSDSALIDHLSQQEDSSCRRRRRLFVEQDEDQVKDAEIRAEHLAEEVKGKDGKPNNKLGFLSGVSLVQNIGNKALANLVGLLNLENQEEETGSSSAEEDEKSDSNEQNMRSSQRNIPSESQAQNPLEETRQRLSIIFSYIWSRIIIKNTDIVCYVLFVFVYVWNFSLLTLVYPASLFLYALLVNPGPSQLFWSSMLFYTELNILLQYMYQTFVNHCGHDELPVWLKKLGIPGRNMNRSFVASVLPLFLVYLATLVQNSIKAREGEWIESNNNTFFTSRRIYDAENQNIRPSWNIQRIWELVFVGTAKTIIRCWRALTSGCEVPPHFVQVTLSVSRWPEDGIQPERIERAFNSLLAAVSIEKNLKSASSVRVESIECGSDGSTAFAVLEVVHAARPAGASSLFTSLTPASDIATEILQAKKQEQLLDSCGFPYPILSVVAGGRRQVDLYAYVFGTDLIAFLYVALFYQSFIKNSPEFLDVYQLEDQFPKEFVFVLMTLFFLIVLDRVLYLSAFAVGKVFYYLFTLVLYTSYVTNYVWSMELNHNSTGIFFQLLPLRAFYLLKALSLALQASQLRYGLPNKSTLYEQFLMRRVSNLSWLGFRIYRSLPFLFELRCVLDWSCTTTSLSMYDWLKLEDIYASLFLVQCDIKLAREKHKLGEKRSAWLKFINGICLFLILICVIWAPMLIYSSGNPTNYVNEITEARCEIGIRTSGGSFTLYKSQLCKLHSFNDIFDGGFDVDTDNVLGSFDTKDVQLICCEEDADTLWLIPPPTLRNLVSSFGDGVLLVPSWIFHRERPKSKEMVTFTGQPLALSQLKAILNGSLSSVRVSDLYPKYFRVTSAGEVRVLEQTFTTVSGNLTLNREAQSWWSFFRENASHADGCGSISGPVAIVVSEEVPKGLIGDTLSKFNIWSLYLTFVLAVGRFIRLQCADLRMRIPYENFPSCDRLVAICEDIYAARAEGELEIEEGLFWTLVKIYRSPHILLEYTKTE